MGVMAIPGAQPGLDTVLCDVGDVILLFDLAVSAAIEARHGLPPGSILPAAVKSPQARLAMTGQIGYAQWRDGLEHLLGAGAVAEWLDYHGAVNHAMVEILKAVRNRDVRVVLLSNATARLWDDLSFHGLDGLADQVFCSADIGAAKPDPAAYAYAARRGGFRLERALYIDDTASWVAAGRELGLRGHVFTGVEQVRAELETLGLLP